MVAVKLLLLGTLVAVLATEESSKAPVEVITETSFVNEDGYNFAFKTSDGTSRKEEAQLITVGNQTGIGVKGSYSYTAPDGQEYQVTFTADDKGYNPTIRVVPQGSSNQ